MWYEEFEKIKGTQLTPKRLQHGSGIDTLYPYYAGFSAEFAIQLLQVAKLSSSAVILDPWNGSGTTTFASAKLGYHSIGTDLNPFSVLLASAKCPSFVSERTFPEVARKIVMSARECEVSIEFDPLLNWMMPTTVENFRRIYVSICRHYRVELSSSTTKRSLPSLLILALIRSVRSLLRNSKNPTWNTPKEPLFIAQNELEDRFITLAGELASVVSTSRPTDAAEPTILLADARCLPIPKNSIDLVLASPPYCTRIDYAVSTNFELAAMGIGDNFNEFSSLRQDLMGTTAIRKSPRIIVDLAPSVANLLEQIKHHASYASTRYYHKNLVQYFTDAHLSISELARLLRPGGRGFLVLQNSYFKDIPIPLPWLYVQMLKKSEFDARILASFPASGYFAKINKGAARYNCTRSYEESLVVFEKLG